MAVRSWQGPPKQPYDRALAEIAPRPTRLDVIDESDVHPGHRNSPGTGDSHFYVLVMSPEGKYPKRLQVITKRHCPHTGIVNFYSNANPLLA